MEDSHIAQLDIGNGIGFFGVYDGHGGKLNWEFMILFDRQWGGWVCARPFGRRTEKITILQEW